MIGDTAPRVHDLQLKEGAQPSHSRGQGPGEAIHGENSAKRANASKRCCRQQMHTRHCSARRTPHISPNKRPPPPPPGVFLPDAAHAHTKYQTPKYTCDTGQTRNKLLEQWVHLTNRAAGHSRPGTTQIPNTKYERKEHARCSSTHRCSSGSPLRQAGMSPTSAFVSRSLPHARARAREAVSPHASRPFARRRRAPQTNKPTQQKV